MPLILSGARHRAGGGGGGGPDLLYGLRWDGRQVAHGGTILVSNGGLTVQMTSANNSLFTAIETGIFPVTGPFKFVVRVGYLVLPYSIYLGLCEAGVDIDTFSNQAGHVDAAYTWIAALLRAFSVNDQPVGNLPTTGTIDMCIWGDTSTSWNYRDELGNQALNVGAIVGASAGPLGAFAYVQGTSPVTFQLLTNDGNVAGLPSDADFPNVAN